MIKPRYEFKYVVTHEQARALLKETEEAMVPDKRPSYYVNSIYYDTDDFLFYYEKLDGVDPRYKVRVRWYGDLKGETDLDSVALFFECKHRRNQMVHKDRVQLPGSLLPQFFAQKSIPVKVRDHCKTGDLEEAAVIDHAVSRHELQSRCIVRYFRRIYSCRINPTLRVTLDTDLHVLGVREPFSIHDDAGSRFLPPHLCILEIKFHYAMPLWLGDVCRSLGLNLRRYSKYCSALEAQYPDIAARSVQFQSAW